MFRNALWNGIDNMFRFRSLYNNNVQKVLIKSKSGVKFKVRFKSDLSLNAKTVPNRRISRKPALTSVVQIISSKSNKLNSPCLDKKEELGDQR